ESADGTRITRFDGVSDRPVEIDHNGQITRFEYDDAGLLLASEDADGYRVDITRDERGLPVRITDGMLEHEFTYDDAGRVVEEGSGDVRAAATYGPDGLVSEMVTASERT